MLSQLDGFTERQNTKPSTNKDEMSQAKHNQFSLQSQLLFCISKPRFQESQTLTRSRKLKENSSAAWAATGLCRPHAQHCLGLRESFQSSAPYTAHGFPEKSHNCASREADRKTLLLFISSEHGGGPEGKQKGHKRRCLKVSSPSILPPPDSELSLLTETVSKRKFQPK